MKAKDVKYKQCTMIKSTDLGFKRHVAWIPKQFAVIGKIIDIDDHGSGWKVVTTGGDLEISAKAADSMSQMHKKTRKASDI